MVTILFVPAAEIGFTPIPTLSSNRIFVTPKSFLSTLSNLLDWSLLASNSTPQYISSEFSLNMTISTSWGLLTGDGTPSKYLIGLRQMYKSIICLRETFNDLIPPPTGVVSGPFILTTYSLSASIVSSGSHVSLSYFLVAFSPQ